MGDTSKVKLKRVAGVDPVTQVTYTPFRTPERDLQAHSRGFDYWYPGAQQDTFEVSADIASAAVETGGFEVAADSRVKLKGTQWVEIESAENGEAQQEGGDGQ